MLRWRSVLLVFVLLTAACSAVSPKLPEPASGLVLSPRVTAMRRFTISSRTVADWCA